MSIVLSHFTACLTNLRKSTARNKAWGDYPHPAHYPLIQSVATLPPCSSQSLEELTLCLCCSAAIKFASRQLNACPPLHKAHKAQHLHPYQWNKSSYTVKFPPLFNATVQALGEVVLKSFLLFTIYLILICWFVLCPQSHNLSWLKFIEIEEHALTSTCAEDLFREATGVVTSLNLFGCGLFLFVL